MQFHLMEPGDETYHSIESEKTAYSLSAEDFKREPTSLTKNPLLGIVTRDNFTATMISTFAYSQGEVAAQLLELDWMKQAHGFDFEGTLQHFISVDGVFSLTKDEQQQIIDSYWRIKGHTEGTRTDSPLETDKAVLKNFNISLSEFSTDAIAITRDEYQDVLKEHYPDLMDLRGLPFNQFLAKLKRGISSEKQEIPENSEE